MTTKWGLTKTAINKGYGINPSKMLAIHPEFMFQGPYGTVRTRTPSRGGGKLKKGSAEAKAYMARLRRMRGKKTRTSSLNGSGWDESALRGFGCTCGCGGYDEAALNGYGYDDAAMMGYGYENAAINGAGVEDIVTALWNSIGDSAMKIIGELANRLQTSVQELANDPDRLLAILQDVAPKIVSPVKKFFINWWTKRKNKKQNKHFYNYMQTLKREDPTRYQQVYNELLRRKKEAQDAQYNSKNSVAEV